MAHFNFYQKKKEDKIVYSDGIVDGIILLAVSELSHVELYSQKPAIKKKTGCIKVNSTKEGLEIEIFVKVHYSQSVSDTAFKIQETIRHNIESMTDYRIKYVNVNVVGVFFEEKDSKKTTQTTKTNVENSVKDENNQTKEITENN
jgi:uncharacterized alkaline shock family protein YloU